MSTPLERQLAEALARAVDDEASRCVFNKGMGKPYLPRAWFQPAVEALAEYEEQNRPRVNY